MTLYQEISPPVLAFYAAATATVAAAYMSTRERAPAASSDFDSERKRLPPLDVRFEFHEGDSRLPKPIRRPL